MIDKVDTLILQHSCAIIKVPLKLQYSQETCLIPLTHYNSTSIENSTVAVTAIVTVSMRLEFHCTLAIYQYSTLFIQAFP